MQDDLRQFLLALGHCVERNTIRRFGYTQNHPRILHRKEPLGHDDVEKQGQHQRAKRHQQCRRLVLQHPLHRASVKGDDPVVIIFRDFVEASLLAFLAMLEQLGRHHGRKA